MAFDLDQLLQELAAFDLEAVLEEISSASDRILQELLNPDNPDT